MESSAKIESNLLSCLVQLFLSHYHDVDVRDDDDDDGDTLHLVGAVCRPMSGS